MNKKALSWLLAFSMALSTLFASAGQAEVWAKPKAQSDDEDEEKKETASDHEDEEKKESASEDLKDKVLKDLPTEWDLTDLYEDEEAFEADMKRVDELLPVFEKYRGTLDCVEGILAYLEDEDILEIQEIMNKLILYSQFLSSLDGTDPTAKKLSAEKDACHQKIMLAVSFEEPEIMELPLKKRQEIFEDESLAPYKYYMRRYTDPDYKYLSEGEMNVKTIMEGADIYEDVRSIFDYIELEKPEFTYPDGKKGTLDDQTFSRIVESPEYDHEFRKEMYMLRFARRQPFANTYAGLLEGRIRSNWAKAQIDGFDSTLEAAFYKDDVDPEIYEKIIDFAHSLLPKFHEYYAQKKELHGYDEMMSCDFYQPVSDYAAKEISYEDAMNRGRSAITVWGDEYLEAFDKIVESPHIDVYPAEKKEGGAYEYLLGKTNTPFVLYNFDGSESFTSTLVHEMGHAVYSELSVENQNDYNCEPTIFTQEVASTSNEIMLMKSMVENAKTEDEKIFWLDREISLFVASLLNQCMLSEFEDYCYKVVEGGDSLDAEKMGEKYVELMRTYYGDAITVPDEAGVDWARVPHFYYNYYVYKYATSITYAAAICNLVEENGKRETDAYLEFLKAGNSADPSSLLAIAGVDPLDDDTYESAGKLIEDLIDEFTETASSYEKAGKDSSDDKKGDDDHNRR